MIYNLTEILDEGKQLAKLPLISVQAGFESWTSTTKDKTHKIYIILSISRTSALHLIQLQKVRCSSVK